MAKIFITRPIPEPALDLFKDAGFEFVVGNKQNGLPKKTLIKTIENGEFDAVLSFLTDSIDKDVINAFTKTGRGKIIANYAVGFNNIDTVYAKSKNVIVTNTVTSADSVAEFSAMLILALGRKLFSGDAYVRRGSFKGFEPCLFQGNDMRGRILGIVGTGRIGGSLARIMSKGFNMNILYSDVVRNEVLERECNARQVPLEDLLRLSNVVSLHVPLMEKTHHLINKENLAFMRKDAILINTARGPVVDEKALAEALAKGEIAGAALDVFEFEPKITRALTKLPNVILTPHIASSTFESRRSMSRLAAENIIHVLSGRKPLSQVN
jgi:glyoxylate reductase